MSEYNLIRCFISIALFAFLIIMMVKVLKNRKNILKILAIAMCIALMFISSLPVENLFIDFSSIEDVFEYKFSGEIINTVKGSDSCFVEYKTNSNSYSTVIFPQNENGCYKIPVSWEIGEIAKNFENQNYTVIQSLANSNDFYVNGQYNLPKDKDMNIFDDLGSKFNYYEIPIENSEYKLVLYYAKLEKYTANYSININSKIYYLT